MRVLTNKNFDPQLRLRLAQLKPEFLHNVTHGLKNPLAILNTSLNKLESDLQDFFNTYNEFTLTNFVPGQNKDGPMAELLKRYKSYLYSCREYLDDIYNIAKTFAKPEVTYKQRRNQFDWLKLNCNSLPFHAFLEATIPYKLHLDEIVNELKHRNGILGSATFVDDSSRIFSMGYFVANVVDGVYQPVQTIHKQFMGEHTAISFGRDIRYHVCNTYFLTKYLEDLLFGIGAKYDGQITHSCETEPKRNSLYARVSLLPRHFFPDET